MPDCSFFINKVGPVHASQYISTDQILLASGAGPSKTGQKNRLATYSISQSVATSANPAERHGILTGEVLLADDEDAPSSFATHGDLIIAGVNESTASRKKTGDNHHLRTFRMTKESSEKAETTTIKTLPQHQIYEDLSIELDDYQKVTKVNGDGRYAALISSEGLPALVDLKKMTKLPIDILDSTKDGGKRKVVDIELLKDSIWVAEAKRILAISLPTGDDVSILFNLDDTGVPKNYRLSHIRILGAETVLLGLNHQTLQHAFIAIYKLYKGTLIQCQVAHASSRLRGLYINTRHPTPTNPTMVAMTTANGALHLFNADLIKLKTWPALHQFPISTVSFRADSKQLITCSIDEKINVLDLTQLKVQSMRSVLALFMILIIAIFIALVYTGKFNDPIPV